ncbi:MAG: NAD-dependent epimerase/dehydratase family protein [Sphaerochaetaceae bacterium]
MKVVLIGATGHIGTYLVPRLVEAGHSVTAVSSGERAPPTLATLLGGVLSNFL